MADSILLWLVRSSHPTAQASTLDDTPAEGQFLYLSVDGANGSGGSDSGGGGGAGGAGGAGTAPVPSDFYLALAGNFTAALRAGRVQAGAPLVQAGGAAERVKADAADMLARAVAITKAKDATFRA